MIKCLETPSDHSSNQEPAEQKGQEQQSEEAWLLLITIEPAKMLLIKSRWDERTI